MTMAVPEEVAIRRDHPALATRLPWRGRYLSGSEIGERHRLAAGTSAERTPDHRTDTVGDEMDTPVGEDKVHATGMLAGEVFDAIERVVGRVPILRVTDVSRHSTAALPLP